MESNPSLVKDNKTKESVNEDNEIIEQNPPMNKEDEQAKKSKIKMPKRQYAIIHGYNGHNFCGNQKNNGVRTVEEELENALYEGKFISECNYGFLVKINWVRASRTDKKVSAIMNVVSCKLHKYPDLTEEDMKNKINSLLPKDIRIFRIIEVSEHFDAKSNNNHREYHYILPSFMLEPKVKDFLPTNTTTIKEVSSSEPTFHNPLTEEEMENAMKDYKANYSFKITPEYKEKIMKICEVFKGTKKFHNYSKRVEFTDAQSSRHIYDLSILEIIPLESFEIIKFKIVGQSFLYNQIRKMIGMVIDLCRDCKDITYMNQTFLSEKIEVPKAPGEGLFLRKIDYSRYNDRKLYKKSSIKITEQEEKEMDLFCNEIINDIEVREINERSFSKWQWKFDYFKEHIY